MDTVRLFHISEDPGIRRFDPRPSRSSHYSIQEPVVWAVAEDRLYNYLVPRNCPRISFFAADTTHDDDIVVFLDGDRTRRVLVLETDWFDRVKDTALVQYEFAPSNFSLFDETAGYYLSPRAEVPISTQTLVGPLKQIFKAGVEVRFTPSFWAIRERVLSSSLGFSFIRMSHAASP